MFQAEARESLGHAAPGRAERLGTVVRWLLAASAVHLRSRTTAARSRIARMFGAGPRFETRPLSSHAACAWLTIERQPWKKHPAVCLAEPREIGGARSAHFARHRQAPVFDRHLSRIAGARIFSRDQFLFLPDGSLLIEQHYFNRRYLVRHPRLIAPQTQGRVIRGPAFSIAPAFPNWHYHWMAEFPTRLFGVLDALPAETTFLIPKGMAPVHREALGAFGIDECRLLEVDDDDLLTVEDLWFAPPLMPPGWHFPAAAIWIRGRFWNHFLHRTPDARERGSRKIFISRRNATQRRVLNEDELAAAAAARGYACVECEKLSLAAQVRLFSEAAEVIAPHGAGLVNLLFAPVGGRVLEIHARQIPEMGGCYRTLAAAIGWDYAYSQGATPYEGRATQQIVADVDAIARWMDEGN